VFDACHGFRPNKTRKFFDTSNMLKNLRDRELGSLIERAKRAVRYRKLVVEERTIITTLKKKYEILIESYRRVRAEEVSAIGRLKGFRRLEIRYRDLERKAKITEKNYYILIDRYRRRRKELEVKVKFIREKEKTIIVKIKRLERRIEEILIQIKKFQEEIIILRKRYFENDLRIKQIRTRISVLKVRLTRLYSFSSRFEKLLVVFNKERREYERQITFLRRKEQSVSVLIRDLKALNKQMWRVNKRKAKIHLKRKACHGKIKYYQKRDEKFKFQLEVYRKEIKKLIIEIKRFEEEENEFIRKNREIVIRKREIRRRISELNILIIKIRREREDNIKILRDLIREEKEIIIEIRKIKRIEIEIREKIKRIVIQIREYEIQIRETRVKEGREEIIIKRLTVERIRIKTLITELVIEIKKKHIKLLDEYSDIYHKNLEGPSGRLDCSKCFRKAGGGLIRAK